MRRLRILTLCSIIIAIMIFCLKKRSPATIAAGKGLVVNKTWLTINKNHVTPIADIRPADQTFLTYPEWFLVFSPEEQADYFETRTSSSFPYMTHVKQFWQGYKIVYNQIKDNYPYNGGYHLMIWVIGISTSVEYAIKSFYETIIGRITDTGVATTDEDKFDAKYMKDYVRFIKDRPWYEFDFKSRLKSLWTETSFFDYHPLRKIERKYFLTSELATKIVYGWLIKLGTKSVYDTDLLTTDVVVDSLPTGLPKNSASVKYIKTFSDKSALVSLPRYNDFNPAICQLALEGATFKEIAGNNSAILLSILVPVNDSLKLNNAQLIFTQPIPTKPGLKRMALVSSISKLNLTLKELLAQHITIEHIYDF